MSTKPITCNNCGACCFEQGSPPGYLWLLSRSKAERADWPDQDDVRRINRLPREALKVLHRYRRDLLAKKVDGDGPCCWLDPATLRCRWYDHRPQICRDFEVGSEDCRCWRDEYNIVE